MPEPYHAALRPPLPAAGVDRYGQVGGAVFVHDLLGGPLPADYDACDLIYADLPWRTGFDIFNARARVDDGRTYPALLAAVRDQVRKLGVPAVLVTGRRAVDDLDPDGITPVTLNGQAAVAAQYGDVNIPAGLDARDVLRWLAGRYGHVGDPFCGYGRTVRMFTGRGKRFVASDYNRTCVGFVAAHALEWGRA